MLMRLYLAQGAYMHHVEAMLNRGGARLLLSLDDLRSFDAELTRATTTAAYIIRHAGPLDI